VKIAQITPGVLPIPPNGWGAVEKIIWEYKKNFELLGHVCDIKYLNEVSADDYDVIHIHMANLCLEASSRKIPYIFTMHDHHAFHLGLNSSVYRENSEAIQGSVKSFVPARYLVDYFCSRKNLFYVPHGVDSDFFQPQEKINPPKLLCVGNNGLIGDPIFDRKGFIYAIEAARTLNLPITVVGPVQNKYFFENNKDFVPYDQLEIIYNANEEELKKIYQKHSIFLHPSMLEAGHPNLTLMEAMSCGLPVISCYEDGALPGMVKISRSIDSICDAIKQVIDNDSYRTNAIQYAKNNNWNFVCKKILNLYKENFSMKKQLMKNYFQTKQNLKQTKPISNSIFISFLDGPKVEAKGLSPEEYKVRFINNDKIDYECIIKNNEWAAASKKYFVNWKVEITELKNGKITTIPFDPTEKKIRIINESPSLGDFIAWMPFVDLFQKKYSCIVDFYTPRKELFINSYLNINFFNYNDNRQTKYYAGFKIGCFENHLNLAPVNFRSQPLQKVASDVLGIEYKEMCPQIFIANNEKMMAEKYVCISTSSTAGCKEWNDKEGWPQVIEYLKSLNYKVVLIQSQEIDNKKIFHPSTPDIQDAISWLNHAEFYIGLGSGISWLSWVLGKKVILISGFSLPESEFFTPYRVINKSVCHGCWNDSSHKFNKGDWNWCPKFKGTDQQFECSKQISFEMVKEKIDQCVRDIG